MTINLDLNRPQNHTNFSFGANPNPKRLSRELTENLSRGQKFLSKVIDLKEGDSGLSHSRFAQATLTNWFPKAIFSRSIADLSEVTFLEVMEGALFFYLPSIVGEHLSRRKIFNKFLPKELHDSVSKPVAAIVKEGGKNAQKLLPVKAAIVLSCAAIPAAEYGLSFAKNLFTLKVFKKADFTSVVNLDKSKKVDEKTSQERVEKSAKSHLKKVGIFSGLTFIGSLVLGTLGQKSKGVAKACEYFLNPGEKLYKGLSKVGVNSQKLEKFLNKYLNLDFARKSDGGLALGHGQLAVTVLAGVKGYFDAAHDRGKLDVQEVATRVPIIALYTIFGSALFDEGFKNLLYKNKKYADILTKNEKTGEFRVAGLDELPEIAKRKVNSTDKQAIEKEVQKLFKGKAVISLVPFLFSLGVVGALLSLVSRIWTQHRYDKLQAQKAGNNQLKTGA